MKENKTENLLWIIFTIIGGIFVVIGLIIVGNVFNYENKESTVGIITEVSTYRGNNDDRNYRVYVSYNVDGRTYESGQERIETTFNNKRRMGFFFKGRILLCGRADGGISAGFIAGKFEAVFVAQ